MKTDISHLPDNKQRELRLIVETITALVDVELIVLFGSYARGNWVEDSYVEGHITYEYRSDYDLLVVTDLVRTKKSKPLWSKVEQRVHEHPALKTWPNLIVEDCRPLQKHLQEGHYFYTDLYKEGIVLYDSGRVELEPPRELDAKERKEQAQEDFEFWFNSADEFFIDFQNAFERGSYAKAAFELHQSVERFYNTVLLVYTGYKAKQHDIEKLRKQVVTCDPRFIPVFPHVTKEDKKRFELLKKAYIESRYNKKFKASREDLEWLAQRVEHLRSLVEQSCRERIQSF
ncbi:hypothetical protein CAI21_08625 [Alkalilimnicola ehrlichii]|uniref:HEPN domain-containing protein n=2 Tax=Alkalilimnicola ehrlichii TaxID=351052 RepID=A0A3E0WX32_9GAMM|nr:HEPN domain-containing protein [Alkalilimnicola ehrlichii]RFA29888.1 hypothetical protein CAI21_08625 [Alkalilimnicola ehrlichii]RFA36477.1 hypothetical protein CAL65_10895 [Alkalilimnicola ehrlichii]